MDDDYSLDTDEGLSLEELAETMYDDFHHFSERENYDWKGGTLRPQDYETVDSVERALEAWAPFPDHHEAEAAFGDQDAGTHADFSYNVRHVTVDEL